MFTNILHNRVAAVSLAGVLAVAALGAGSVAMAQTGGGTPSTTATPTATPNAGAHHPRARILQGLMKDVIAKSGLTQGQIKDGFKDGKSLDEILGANAASVKTQVQADAGAKINQALSNGTITQAQADKLTEKLPAILDRLFSAQRGTLKGRLQHLGNAALATAASVIGVTPETLKADLQAGKSIAEVAGPKTQDVINALDAKVDARIDTAVANGRLTPERAANLKTRAHDRIEKFVNNTHQHK